MCRVESGCFFCETNECRQHRGEVHLEPIERLRDCAALQWNGRGDGDATTAELGDIAVADAAISRRVRAVVRHRVLILTHECVNVHVLTLEKILDDRVGHRLHDGSEQVR